MNNEKKCLSEVKWPEKISYFHSKKEYPYNCVEAANKMHDAFMKVINALPSKGVHKCEYDNVNYATIPKCYRCKNCKHFWFDGDPVPECKAKGMTQPRPLTDKELAKIQYDATVCDESKGMVEKERMESIVEDTFRYNAMAKEGSSASELVAYSLEGNIIDNLFKLEFFKDGQVIANDEIPVSKLSAKPTIPSVEEILATFSKVCKCNNCIICKEFAQAIHRMLSKEMK